jgi:hypothetical protein
MLLRELTNNIKRPVKEGIAIPAWLALDQLIGASPAGEFSDMSPMSQFYGGLSQKPDFKDGAADNAREFRQLLQKEGPSKRVQDMYRGATGRDLLSDHPQLKNITKSLSAPTSNNIKPRPPGGHARRNWDKRHGTTHNPDGTPKVVTQPNTITKVQPNTQPRDGGNPGGVTTSAPAGTDTAPNVTSVAPKQPNVKADVVTAPIVTPNITKPKVQTTAPKLQQPAVQDPTTMLSQVPNVVNKGSEAALAKELTKPNWMNNLGDTLSKHTGMSGSDISKFASKVGKYAIPAGIVLALLYGGSKLVGAMSKKKKKNEAATAGATSAGSIASVANPTQAYGHRKRDKNGVPKAPQKKNPDGTAKSALDISDNLMGGKTIKR